MCFGSEAPSFAVEHNSHASHCARHVSTRSADTLLDTRLRSLFACPLGRTWNPCHMLLLYARPAPEGSQNSFSPVRIQIETRGINTENASRLVLTTPSIWCAPFGNRAGHNAGQVYGIPGRGSARWFLRSTLCVVLCEFPLQMKSRTSPSAPAVKTQGWSGWKWQSRTPVAKREGEPRETLRVSAQWGQLS